MAGVPSLCSLRGGAAVGIPPSAGQAAAPAAAPRATTNASAAAPAAGSVLANLGAPGLAKPPGRTVVIEFLLGPDAEAAGEASGDMGGGALDDLLVAAEAGSIATSAACDAFALRAAPDPSWPNESERYRDLIENYEHYKRKRLINSIVASFTGMTKDQIRGRREAYEKGGYLWREEYALLEVSAGRKPTLPAEVEDEIVDLLVYMAETGAPMAPGKLDEIVMDVIEFAGWTHKLVGNDHRHISRRIIERAKEAKKLVIRSPEDMERGRAAAITEDEHDKFLEKLYPVLTEHVSDDPACIWNLDEMPANQSTRKPKVRQAAGTAAVAAGVWRPPRALPVYASQ
jgi:hypothetical protein